MARYGAMFGPDYTFLGVPMCDIDDESTWADAQVVVIGAPFDGGTSNRAGARFGPRAIRAACYLGFDGSRPSLALRGPRLPVVGALAVVLLTADLFTFGVGFNAAADTRVLDFVPPDESGQAAA